MVLCCSLSSPSRASSSVWLNGRAVNSPRVSRLFSAVMNTAAFKSRRPKRLTRAESSIPAKPTMKAVLSGVRQVSSGGRSSSGSLAGSASAGLAAAASGSRLFRSGLGMGSPCGQRVSQLRSSAGRLLAAGSLPVRA